MGTKPSLLDVPLEIMDNIWGMLGMKDKLRLEGVSKGMKALIQSRGWEYKVLLLELQWKHEGGHYFTLWLGQRWPL